MGIQGAHEAAPEPGTRRDRRGSTRVTRDSALVSLVGGVLTVGLVWGQHHFRVLHPHYLPHLILLTTTVVGFFVSVFAGAWGTVTGPSRTAALAWASASAVPLLFWAYVGLYAQANWRERHVPNDLPMNLAKGLAVPFMRLEATAEYPNRLETGRLVMFYDRLAHPRRDAEAMDRHLAGMEAMLGGPLRAKVFWVRGDLPVLGLSSLSTGGIAPGSGESPSDWGVEGSLDRHELAHAAIDTYRARGADPAYFLHEGWAEARSGVGTAVLALRAVEHRSAHPSIRVRDMVSRDWYHRDLGPVYSLGGGFVDFLIRKHGAGRFLRLFNEGQPGNFDATCREIFGADLGDLEGAFWEDAEGQVATRRSGGNPVGDRR